MHRLERRIHNYRELAETLRGLGHSCRTPSDTEVVVHAYEQWGDECVLKLDGMFAFAVWDSARSRLLVGRDRLGKKPLYYCTDGHRLLFASEIKALLEDPAVPRRVNYRALQAYLVLG